jgi:hypothetical protein
MNKKIAIFTTFGGWDEAYSPCNVVKNQLISLVKNGYHPTLFVLDCFPTEHFMKESWVEGFELAPVIPTLTFEPYHGITAHRKVPPNFEKDVAKVTPVLDQQLKDFDVVLCHDIIFQDSFLPYNAALRKTVMKTGQLYLHWMHSGPSARPDNVGEPISFLYSLPPQSKLVYMNNYDIIRVAEMYNTMPNMVRVVHNPIDYTTYPWIHPLVKKLINDYKMNEADIIGVYPLSTTRMGAGGKQLHKALKVMGYLKQLGKNVRYIVANAHANGDKEKMAIMEMLALAKDYGLTDREVIFTSFVDKQYEGGVPHEVVLQLFQYSDVFIFPSVSENAPLALLEAGLAKNLLILNEDFSPMKDFVGPHALYFKFDSIVTVTHHPNENVYYADVARLIISALENNREHKSRRQIRQKFNHDYIFKNELEILFNEV